MFVYKKEKEPKGSFFLTALFFLSVTENTDCGREDREAFIEHGTDVEVDGGIHRHQRAGEEDAVSKSLRRKRLSATALMASAMMIKRSAGPCQKRMPTAHMARAKKAPEK